MPHHSRGEHRCHLPGGVARNGGAVDVYVEDYGDLAVVSCSGHGFVFDLGDWDMWSGGPIVCMVTNVACRR